MLATGARPRRVVISGMGLEGLTDTGKRAGHFRNVLENLGKHERGSPAFMAEAFLKWLFVQLHMIPVDRHNMDMTAVRACLKALKDGHPLGHLISTGLRPKFLSKLAQSGVHVDTSVFAFDRR